MTDCNRCKNRFEITPSDRAFYQKMGVPEPTLCSDCRLQNRMAFRNEWKFYQRACASCQKSCISLYSADKPWTVYCSTCWWGDGFDPLAYGRDFDFSRPFFEQYAELLRVVPKMSIQNIKSENCDYTNYSAENRNCYMIVGSLGSENAYYGYRIFYSRDTLDNYDLYKCELSYECVLCNNLYNSYYCYHCDNSSDMVLSRDCTGCESCFGCVGLRNQRYTIFNKPYSKDDYEKEKARLLQNFDEARRRFAELQQSLPCRAVYATSCEGSSGDELMNCKNCRDSFVLKDSEECADIAFGSKNKNCYDANFVDNCEWQYNSIGLEQNYNMIVATLSWYTRDAAYVTNTFNSHDVFGCVGLKRHQYCIFNKQYAKEEYSTLKAKIVEHMKRIGEWGQYFPHALSPFSYNESTAQDFYPLTKDAAIAQGYLWKEDSEKMSGITKIIPAEKLPASINDIPDDVLNWAIKCETTGRLFRLIPQELKFYRDHQLPIPHAHPDERNRRRMALSNPHRLYNRACAKCGTTMQTTYAPDRPEVVYCESCYLKEIY